jgi:hypothetical protein
VLSTILVTASVSKTPFYLAGGLLAVWAVALAGVGITKPSFPGGLGGQRAVILISLLLVALTIAMAIHTSTFE